MITSHGDRIICSLCGTSQKCIGTIIGQDEWYGTTIVRVRFHHPKWDECEETVFDAAQIKRLPNGNGKNGAKNKEIARV